MLGVFAGQLLRSPQSDGRKLGGLAALGLSCLSVGYVWSRLVVQHLAAAGVATSLIDWPIWFPIIENRWTSTFALYAGGWSYLALEMFADLGFRACVAYSGHWPGDVCLARCRRNSVV